MPARPGGSRRTGGWSAGGCGRPGPSVLWDGSCPPPPAALITPTPSGPSRPAGCRTHNVRSLGMWLKLETGMDVMLLLFRVLQEGRGREVRVGRLEMGARDGSGGTEPGSSSTQPPPRVRWLDGEVRAGGSSHPWPLTGLPAPAGPGKPHPLCS